MSFEITGTIAKIYETETKGESFKTREFVIETKDGEYSNYVKFQAVQERTGIIDPYTEGQEIKVHFDLRGRQWQEKFFTNLNAWRVEGVSAAPATKAAPKAAKANVEELVPEADGDLPF